MSAVAAFSPRNPDYQERVRESFQRQGAMHLIGARLTRVAPGECEIQLPFRDDLGQQHGFFHGGILSTIADSAAGYAGFSLMPRDASVLTIEFKTNFLAPAAGELLDAAAVLGAIERLLAEGGPRTPDLGGQASTAELGQALAEAL